MINISEQLIYFIASCDERKDIIMYSIIVTSNLAVSEGLIQWFTVNLGGILSKELIVFVISMLPILELRGGLLAASPAFLNVAFKEAVILCLLGNIIPIPFILIFIKKIFALMRKNEKLGYLVEKLENKALCKKDKIESYGFWGLVIFVGIPAPGTGAWTGALIASILQMDIRKSVLAISIGLLMAAVIMSAVSYGLLSAF